MSPHLKRLAAPRVLKIHRKEAKWTFRPSPGAHAAESAIPLATLVRDYLGLCATGREARRIIGAGEIAVDGAVRKDSTFPVGLMDVVTVRQTKTSYRILLERHGWLFPVPIPTEDSTWKLCRVTNKTTVRGGKTQINLHDGRNLLVPKDEHKTGDVLKLSVPAQKVVGALKFAKGTLALVTGGEHSGEIAPIDSVEVKRGPLPNMVVLKAADGREFRTIKEYVFPVGEKTPLVQLPEVTAIAR